MTVPSVEYLHTFAAIYGKDELIDAAYIKGREDARKEIADSNGGDDTAYRLSYGDGSFHTKIYRTRGLARQARKMMGEPRSNELRIQELKGVWVTVE